MPRRVVILGDGQMALVLADALAERGVEVRLWAPFEEEARELARTRRSPRRLPGFTLPEGVEVTADPAAADLDVIVNAIPTQFIRGVWARVAPHAQARANVICVSKGIEQGTLRTPCAIIEEMLGGGRSTCALSGPTIAAELARRLPAAMVAASADEGLTALVQDLFHVPWLRIYRHDDPLGVELAGATKNVIALAAGIVDGLGAGDNAKSAVLARGLAEIARLGAALGARVDTFFGIAGVGDLATTCFSPSGRNRTCGERLGRGEGLDEILASTVSVVEGVPTTRAVMELARRSGVDMPITAMVHRILFDGLPPRDAIRALMSRELKAETIG